MCVCVCVTLSAIKCDGVSVVCEYKQNIFGHLCFLASDVAVH